MKKLFLLATLGLVMGACSNDEDVVSPSQQGQEISFKALTKGETRNEILGNKDNTLLTSWKIYLAAAYLNKDNATELLFENQLFKCQNGTWKGWDATAGAAKKVYYPLGVEAIEFMGYSTDKAVTPSWTTDDNGHFTGMTLDFGNNLDGSEDVVYCSVLKQTLANGNGRPSDNKTLAFNHALSCIYFEVTTNGDSEAKKHVTLDYIKMNGFYISGKFTYAMDENGAWGTSWNFDGLTKTDSYSIKNVKSDEIGVYATGNYAGKMMVAPSGQKAESFTLGVTVDGKAFEKTVTVPDESPVWVSGNTYRYILNLTLTEMDFNTSLEVYPFPASENPQQNMN